MTAAAADVKTQIRSFYDRLSPHFRRLWGPHLHDGFYASGAASKEEAQQALVDHLVGLVGVEPGQRVLDVGSGMGAAAVSLAEDHGASVHGITLSPVQVGMAQELAAERGADATFEVMDAERITLDERFDLIWMLGVLGHLPDQARFVRESPRLLKPGGRFMLADWMLGEDVDAKTRAGLVQTVIDGMLMPQIHTLTDTVGWYEAAGYRVLHRLDLTHETLKTWDEGAAIAQVPDLIKLCLELGRDAVQLLRAIHGMRQAMRSGAIRYGVVIAERS